MESTVRATCPKCQTTLLIPAQWLGQAVKCKKCGAMVRTKARPTDGAAPDDTASNPPPSPASAQPNAFDFSKPTEEDERFFGSPPPAPATGPQPAPAPGLDANGYPIPPGYAYPPAPGYPAGAYPMPPGYPAPPGYPYGPPPGYPYAPMPGYGPPAGYPYPAPPGYPPPAQTGYAALAGYPYPQPVPAVPAPQPAAPASAAPAAPASKPAANGKPGAKGAPVPPSNEFKVDADGANAKGRKGPPRSRYNQRRGGKSKLIWIGVCLLLTAGLVAGGVVGGKALSEKFAKKEKEQPKPEEPGSNTNPNAAGGAKSAAGSTGFPRRMLFISVTKYMYLNPLTSTPPGGSDRVRATANSLAFQWRIPSEKDNNQLFVLSDTSTGPDERLPLKPVVQGAYQKFIETTRAQDRVLIYFGGHALEKDGKAYLAPMEAELDGEEWEKTLIPLSHFYDEVKKCKAAQKVVIWDVCRYNPEKGRVRPGSEPMSEGLYKALNAPPPGVQVFVTCKAGENALEFTQLRPDGFAGPVYSGSAFLEAVKYVGAPSRAPKASPTPADPLPIAEWFPALAKRTSELDDLAEMGGSGGGKQTVTMGGAPPAAMVSPDPNEKAAARFDMPLAPKGASQAEIKDAEREFNLPALKPGLGELGLGDFPFPADVMKEYAADAKIDEILKDKDKYKLRNAVLESIGKLRDKWSSGAGTTRIRNTVAGPVDDKLKVEVKKEQEFWALSIAELELELLKLEGLKEDAKTESSKRWQANFDFALASMKARLAYMNEYNKLLGNLVTESLPELKKDAGQDGYILVASETLKSGKEVKKMAEEAQALFGEITAKYKGTPWAIQAKQEKAVSIGLNWKPASLAAAKKE